MPSLQVAFECHQRRRRTNLPGQTSFSERNQWGVSGWGHVVHADDSATPWTLFFFAFAFLLNNGCVFVGSSGRKVALEASRGLLGARASCTGLQDGYHRSKKRSFRAVYMVVLRVPQLSPGLSAGRNDRRRAVHMRIAEPGRRGAAQPDKSASPSMRNVPNTAPAHHLVAAARSSKSESCLWQRIGGALTGVVLSAALTINGAPAVAAVSLVSEQRDHDVIRETLYETWGTSSHLVMIHVMHSLLRHASWDIFPPKPADGFCT